MSMSDTCSSLLQELQTLWNEIGESQSERDNILLHIENECLHVYRKNVEKAQKYKADLLQTLAAAQAEISNIVSAIGEWASFSEYEKVKGTLKERIAAIRPTLEELKQKREERVNEFQDIHSQTIKLKMEIAGTVQFSNLTDIQVDKMDLTVKKLGELKSHLQDLQIQKSLRLQDVNNQEKRRRLQEESLSVPIKKRLRLSPSPPPPDWLDCPSFGKPIGYILSSKVPLHENFAIPSDKTYNWSKVFEHIPIPGVQIGMVIDLTNTKHYNHVAELGGREIKYTKVACDGVPGMVSVNDFMYEVTQFYSRQSGLEEKFKKYILLHSTHGYNRTGFMIINYLTRAEKVSVTEALEMFANARPPGIHKVEYINSLYIAHREKRPANICPPFPEWKKSTTPHVVYKKDDTDNDKLGDAVPLSQQTVLRDKCYSLLQLYKPEEGNLNLPVSHPVSLNRGNLNLLRTHEYKFSWNPCGPRYMLLITREGSYLMDETFSFRRVRMRFPLEEKNDIFHKQTHHFTILDGVMVLDHVSQKKKKERRFLVDDIWALDDKPVLEPFSERYESIEKIIKCRNNERQLFFGSGPPCYRYDLEPFKVRRKDHWELWKFSWKMKDFIPNITHQTEGLLFKDWNEPECMKRDILKWSVGEIREEELSKEIKEIIFLPTYKQSRETEGFEFFEK